MESDGIPLLGDDAEPSPPPLPRASFARRFMLPLAVGVGLLIGCVVGVVIAVNQSTPPKNNGRSHGGSNDAAPVFHLQVSPIRPPPRSLSPCCMWGCAISSRGSRRNSSFVTKCAAGLGGDTVGWGMQWTRREGRADPQRRVSWRPPTPQHLLRTPPPIVDWSSSLGLEDLKTLRSRERGGWDGARGARRSRVCAHAALGCRRGQLKGCGFRR